MQRGFRVFPALASRNCADPEGVPSDTTERCELTREAPSHHLHIRPCCCPQGRRDLSRRTAFLLWSRGRSAARRRARDASATRVCSVESLAVARLRPALHSPTAINAFLCQEARTATASAPMHPFTGSSGISCFAKALVKCPCLHSRPHSVATGACRQALSGMVPLTSGILLHSRQHCSSPPSPSLSLPSPAPSHLPPLLPHPLLLAPSGAAYFTLARCSLAAPAAAVMLPHRQRRCGTAGAPACCQLRTSFARA